METHLPLLFFHALGLGNKAIQFFYEKENMRFQPCILLVQT